MNSTQIAKTTNAFVALEQTIHATLETYSNVHRGSGHNSEITTRLFEQSRDIVLEYLGLKKGNYIVIFCTPRRADLMMPQLDPGRYQYVSSRDFGLPLGVVALAVERKALPKGIPRETGGGTTKLIAADWVIWGDAPDKFEAGTPAIINIIAFANALQMVREAGKNDFEETDAEKLTASDILYHDDLEKFSGKEMLDELRKTLIGRGEVVPTKEGDKPYINLDNSASTRTFEPIWKAVRQTWRQPQPVQQEIIREVRSICAGFLSAPQADYDVIFTSNTTEAINLAAESFRREPDDGTEPVVLNTLLEHSSNDLPWRKKPGCSLIRLSVNKEGFLDLNGLETIMCAYNLHSHFGKKRIKLVAVSGASNVLGTCNNLEEISRIVHRYGARLLVDAAQMVAHRKVDMKGWGIDYLAFSAHKIYAPFGTGALVVRKGLLTFTPMEIEDIRSSGEENASGIAALGKALVLLQRVGMDMIREEEQELTRRMLNGLSNIPGLTIFGITDPGSPGFASRLGVFVFRLKGKMPNQVAKELARQGIGIRYGCHCSHILVKHLLDLGPKLQKFQYYIVTLFPMIRLPGLARVSLGIENTEEDIDKLILVLGSRF